MESILVSHCVSDRTGSPLYFLSRKRLSSAMSARKSSFDDSICTQSMCLRLAEYKKKCEHFHRFHKISCIRNTCNYGQIQSMVATMSKVFCLFMDAAAAIKQIHLKHDHSLLQLHQSLSQLNDPYPVHNYCQSHRLLQ